MESGRYPMAGAVRAAYRTGQEDETLGPLVRVDRHGQPIGTIQDGDYVIFYDIRGEREVELTSAFVDQEFPHFHRPPVTVHFATMIEYHPSLQVKVAFPPLEQFLYDPRLGRDSPDGRTGQDQGHHRWECPTAAAGARPQALNERITKATLPRWLGSPSTRSWMPFASDASRLSTLAPSVGWSG